MKSILVVRLCGNIVGLKDHGPHWESQCLNQKQEEREGTTQECDSHMQSAMFTTKCVWPLMIEIPIGKKKR